MLGRIAFETILYDFSMSFCTTRKISSSVSSCDRHWKCIVLNVPECILEISLMVSL